MLDELDTLFTELLSLVCSRDCGNRTGSPHRRVRGAQNDVTGEDRMAANGALGGLAGE